MKVAMGSVDRNTINLQGSGITNGDPRSTQEIINTTKDFLKRLQAKVSSNNVDRSITNKDTVVETTVCGILTNLVTVVERMWG